MATPRDMAVEAIKALMMTTDEDPGSHNDKPERSSRVISVLSPSDSAAVEDTLLTAFTDPPNPLLLWFVNEEGVAEEVIEERMRVNTDWMNKWANRPLLRKGVVVGITAGCNDLTVDSSSSLFAGVMTLRPPLLRTDTPWDFIWNICTLGTPPCYSYSRQSKERFQAFDEASNVEKELMCHQNGNYWRVEDLGVRRDQRGKGMGSALMQVMNHIADKFEVEVYLETGTEKNVGMYKHFGYDVAREFKLKANEADPGISLWAMIRKPKPIPDPVTTSP